MWSNKPLAQYTLTSSESPHLVSNFAASFGSVLGATTPWITIKSNNNTTNSKNNSTTTTTQAAQNATGSLPLSWDDVGSVSKTFAKDLKRSSSLKLQNNTATTNTTNTNANNKDVAPVEQQQDTEVLDDVNKLLHEDDIMFQFDDVNASTTLSHAMNEIDEGLSFLNTHPFEHNVQHHVQQQQQYPSRILFNQAAINTSNDHAFKTPPKHRPSAQQPILICKFFADFGICKSGDACRFSHDEQLLQNTSVTFSEPYPTKSPSPPMLTPPPQQQHHYHPYMQQQQQQYHYDYNQVPSSPISIAATKPNSNSNKYCKFYQQGYCRNAESCPFLHMPANATVTTTSPPTTSSFNSPPVAQALSFNSLPSPSSDAMVVSPRILNRAQRSASVNTALTPTTIMMQPSTPTTANTNNMMMSTSNESNKVCPFFLKGECKFGDRCRYSHPKQAILRKNSLHKERQLLSEESLRKFSQIPCKYYSSQGNCPFGDQCFYKHDEFGDFVDHVNHDDDGGEDEDNF